MLDSNALESSTAGENAEAAPNIDQWMQGAWLSNADAGSVCPVLITAVMLALAAVHKAQYIIASLKIGP